MSIRAKFTTSPTKARRFAWIVCALGAMFYCYEYFLRITPSVMLPELMSAFHVNATTIGTIVSFYYFAYTPMQLPVGITMDRYGPRRLLIFAALVCACGVFLFGAPAHFFSFVNDPNPIIIASIGRLMIGFGSAFAFVGVLKLASMWLPPERFALVTGLTMELAMLGAATGDILIAKVVAISGWRATMAFSVIVGLVLAAVIGLVIPDRPSEFVKQTKQHQTTYRELFRDTWKLLQNPVIWLNGFVGCFLYMSLSVFGETWGPQYLHVAHNLPTQSAANITTAIFIAWAIGCPLIGAMATNLKRTLNFLLFGSLAATIFSAAMLYLGDAQGFCLYALIFAFAISSSTQILVFPLAQSLVKHEMSGTAVAITNMLTMLGGAVLTPMVGKLLDKNWDGAMANGIRVYSPHAFTIALSMLVIGGGISFILMLFIKRQLRVKGTLV